MNTMTTGYYKHFYGQHQGDSDSRQIYALEQTAAEFSKLKAMCRAATEIAIVNFFNANGVNPNEKS